MLSKTIVSNIAFLSMSILCWHLFWDHKALINAKKEEHPVKKIIIWHLLLFAKIVIFDVLYVILFLFVAHKLK